MYLYHGYEETGQKLPPITIIILLVFIILNLTVYILAIVKISIALIGFRKMSPEEVEAMGFKPTEMKVMQRRYVLIDFTCLMQGLGILFLLIDIYTTYFTIWAVFGWICYILSMIASYIAYFSPAEFIFI
jgi:hypothetical protein